MDEPRKCKYTVICHRHVGAALEMSSTVMVNKYNFETIDLLRRNIEDWRVEDEVQSVHPLVGLSPI